MDEDRGEEHTLMHENKDKLFEGVLYRRERELLVDGVA